MTEQRTCPKCKEKVEPTYPREPWLPVYICGECGCDLGEKPKIVCLCGSTRFTKEMLIKQWELTKQEYIVLSWCALPDDYYNGAETAHIGDLEGVKEIVDELHKRKIDLSDEIFVVNIGGYIGESTRSEIEYAQKLGKPVKYLESPKTGE